MCPLLALAAAIAAADDDDEEIAVASADAGASTGMGACAVSKIGMRGSMLFTAMVCEGSSRKVPFVGVIGLRNGSLGFACIIVAVAKIS